MKKAKDKNERKKNAQRQKKIESAQPQQRNSRRFLFSIVIGALRWTQFVLRLNLFTAIRQKFYDATNGVQLNKMYIWTKLNSSRCTKTIKDEREKKMVSRQQPNSHINSPYITHACLQEISPLNEAQLLYFDRELILT